MISRWFGRDRKWPHKIEGSPGIGISLDIAFANGEETWSEKVDLVDLLEAVLRDAGHPFQNYKSHLLDKRSGLALMPEIVSFEPTDDGGVQTCSTIQVHHPDLFPDGVFEYQHSIGESTEDSLVKGFQAWLDLDFPPLLDCAVEESNDCMKLEMEFSDPDQKRRIILGPVNYYAESQSENLPEEDDEEFHPGFCSCCLFTNSIEAFEPYLKSDEFYAIRFYAARDNEGIAQADCRVNGEDFDIGEGALLHYIEQWPDLGFEFRKQYIVIQSITD